MTKKLSKKELKDAVYMNNSADLEKRVEDLLRRLTLEEKIKLISGRWTRFHTNSIKRLRIGGFKMIDGPHGIGGAGAIIAGLKKATYFPTAICRASTWNLELSEKFGKALAQEVRAINYHMILAPAINIQRSPLCGRTFEYQTEDPYLNKKLAVAVIKGIQSQRIAACVKHFVCNNQETNRFMVSSEVSERALHEIYLPAFEAAVREADAWAIMACYNKVNGVYGCEHKDLIRKKLIEAWGFRGFVVSDWGGTKEATNTENCVNAGLSLEMPRPIKYKKELITAALQEGKITQETFDDNIRRLLRVFFLVGIFDDKRILPRGGRNTPEHRYISRKIAEEGIILLKNERNLLPLSMEKITRLTVLGPNANKKMAWGGGSSSIRSFYEITPLEGLKKKCKGKIEIRSKSAWGDVAVVFAGLKHKKGNDSEGTDRNRFDLPEAQIELIKHITKENENTIVVLINGSPVGMNDWIRDVPTVIEAWYAGSEAGNVIADILFGNINPSGKLPITFPKKISDSPAHKSEKTFPGDSKVFYDEGIFVGYRYFDTNGIDPLFPFGYGLSYTTFKCDNLKVNTPKLRGNDKLIVTVDVENTGSYQGAEVIQLYIQDIEATVARPSKELKGFKKVKLKPGEKSSVTFKLGKMDFAFYDDGTHGWKVEEGIFRILIGNSSRNILLQNEIEYLG